MKHAVFVILALFMMVWGPGCEGTDTRNQVDDTVEALAGKKQADRMQDMKEDLKQIQDQQAKRLKQIKDAN